MYKLSSSGHGRGLALLEGITVDRLTKTKSETACMHKLSSSGHRRELTLLEGITVDYVRVFGSGWSRTNRLHPISSGTNYQRIRRKS